MIRRMRRLRALDEQVAARRRRMRQRRSMLSDMGVVSVDVMSPPFVISGPFEVSGFLDQIVGLNPLPVYTSSWYTEAPTVVNTQDAWNVVRSTTENFPLWWNRMR